MPGEVVVAGRNASQTTAAVRASGGRPYEKDGQAGRSRQRPDTSRRDASVTKAGRMSGFVEAVGERILAGSVALGEAWRRMLARVPVPGKWVLPLVVAWLLVASLWNLSASGPLLPAFWHAGDSSFSEQTAVDHLLARVPANAVVAATDSLDPHLSDRYTIYLMPDPRSYQAEYVAINLRDAISLSRAADAQMEAKMLASGHYVIVGKTTDVTLLRRIGSPIG